MSVQIISRVGNWDLPEGSVVLGRHSEADISIDDIRLSRRHAEFLVSNNTLTLKDLGSINGVLVNGERITDDTTLVHGDLIVIGPLAFTVQIDESAEPNEQLSAHYHRQNSESEFMPQTDTQRAKTADMDPERMSALAPVQLEQAVGHSSDNRATNPQLTLSDPESMGFQPISSDAESTPARSRIPTDQLMPDQSTKVKTEALLPKNPSEALRYELRSIRLSRSIAGALDFFTGLSIAIIIALPFVLGSLGYALFAAGIRLTDGSLSFGGIGEAAPLIDVFLGIFHLDNWQNATGTLNTLHTEHRQQFVLFFIGSTIGVLSFVLCILFYFVAATMLKGGPLWHRCFGLVIREHATGYYPTALRSVSRWLFFVLLLPVHPFTAFFGQRSLHDLISGCRVSRGHFTNSFMQNEGTN